MIFLYIFRFSAAVTNILLLLVTGMLFTLYVVNKIKVYRNLKLLLTYYFQFQTKITVESESHDNSPATSVVLM